MQSNNLLSDDQTQDGYATLNEEELQARLHEYNQSIAAEMEEIALKKASLQKHIDLKEKYHQRVHHQSQLQGQMTLELEQAEQRAHAIQQELQTVIKSIGAQINDAFSQQDQKTVLEAIQEKLKLIKSIFQSQKSKQVRSCVNCKQLFSELDNNQTSCSFHPEELKYFSCKGCGRDDYFKCCFRCEDCLKGCRQGPHVVDNQ